MDGGTSDGVFDFREFAIKVLRSWRTIFVIMLICSLLGGIYQIYQSRHVLLGQTSDTNVELSEEDESAYQSQLQEYQNELETYEREVRAIENSQGQIRQAQITANTIRARAEQADMRVAAFGVASADNSYRHSRSIIILAHDGGFNYVQAASTYTALLSGNAIYDAVSQEKGASVYTKDISRFYSIGNHNHYILTVSVMGDTAVFCNNVMSRMEAYLKGYISHVETIVGPHDLKILNPDDQPVADGTFYTSMLAVSQERDGVYAELAQQEKAVQTLSTLPTPPKEPTLPNAVPVSRWSIVPKVVLFGVVGLFAGAVIGILLVMLQDTMNVTVTSRRQLSEKYGILILGTLSTRK